MKEKEKKGGIFFIKYLLNEVSVEIRGEFCGESYKTGLRDPRKEGRSLADSSNARIFRDTSRGETVTQLALRAIFLVRDVSCIRHR